MAVSTPRLILAESGPLKVPTEKKKWNLESFKKSFRIKIIRLDDMEMEFDLIGVDAALANAYRRILLSEVPSMAFETIHLMNNTSVIQDEVLAHRLGLIPLKADPRNFEYRDPGATPTEHDTLEFELKVACTRDKNLKDKTVDPTDSFINDKVYSSHFKWIPMGGQADMYEASQVGPVHGDILIDKMRPGQEVDMRLFAVKGIGRDHAKFSPVATASYRLLPTIELLHEVEGELAERMAKCFSPGVIEVAETADGRKVARVKDARYDTCSRNVLQHADLKDAVKMGRIEDHFIFSIESVGALSPDILFTEAIKVLKKKCTTILAELNKSNG